MQAAGQVCIGKEAHRLDERDLVSRLGGLRGVYSDPRREPRATYVLPRLRAMATEPGGRNAMWEASGLSIRALRDVLAGRSRPRQVARFALAKLVQDADMPSAH